MAVVEKILTGPTEPVKRKRVAAYARVSMESDNLLRSLSNQVSSYSKLIQGRSDWEYAGVYADCGITGTSTLHRDEFNRMVRDCEEGKIDLVLTKSISRFARNTVDLLQTVRHLKSLGVEVYFEEQRISSMTCDGEMMLTLLAAFAQEEAESIRDNVQWSVRKRFEQGIPNGHKRFLGYDWDGEKYVIIPEEADIVRRVFRMYLDGKSSVQIAKALNEDGVRNIYGDPISDYNVRFILDNENYTGDLVLQKRYSPRIGKRAVNRGQVPGYRVEKAHEPIIDTETFEKARAMRKGKADAMPEKEISCFSGLLKCGYCGHAVCRRNRSKKEADPVWICNAVDKKGSAACGGSRRLPESELIDAATDILGDGYEEMIRLKVKDIIVYDDRLEFHMSAGKDRTWMRHFRNGAHERGCFSKKICCGKCGALFSREATNKKNYVVWTCKNRRGSKGGCDNGSIRESELRQAMKSVIGVSDDVEMEFYCETDKVLVYDDKLEFYMKNGEMMIWQRK